MMRMILMGALLAVSGCGLSDYESRMAATLKELQEKTRYEALYGPTAVDALVGEGENEEVVEYPITVRLPKAFGQVDWFRPGSEYRNRRETVDDLVLFPPFMAEFPGINRTGETYAEGEDGIYLAYYCYLGVLESRAAKFDRVLSELRAKTAAKLRNVTPWQEVECRDENLVPTTWKMFDAKGTQTFADRSGQFVDLPGTFRVFAREDQGYMILWAVRVPDAIAGKTPLLDIADAVAGTVKISAPAPTEPLATPPADKATPDESKSKDAPAEESAPAEPDTAAEPPTNAPGDVPGDADAEADQDPAP